MTKSKKDWLLDSYEKADGFDQQLNDWKDRLDYERDIAMAKDAMTEATKTYQDSAYRSQQSAPSGKAHTENPSLEEGASLWGKPSSGPSSSKSNASNGGPFGSAASHRHAYGQQSESESLLEKRYRDYQRTAFPYERDPVIYEAPPERPLKKGWYAIQDLFSEGELKGGPPKEDEKPLALMAPPIATEAADVPPEDAPKASEAASQVPHADSKGSPKASKVPDDASENAQKASEAADGASKGSQKASESTESPPQASSPESPQESPSQDSGTEEKAPILDPREALSILELPLGAGPDEIESAYQSLSFRYDPKAFKGDAVLEEKAQAILEKLRLARETLLKAKP